MAFLVFAADLVLPEGRKNLLGWLSIAGLVALIVVSIFMLWDHDETLYNGLLAVDDFALWFKVLFMGIGIFIILSSMDFVEEHLEHKGEFYGLVLFSILGMNIMAQARELLTAYIALELLSFSLYVLAAYARNSAKSNEGGLKYIIIGAFSSAVLLYGVSMIYGVLGVTKFEAIAAGLAAADAVSPALWVGVALAAGGLGLQGGGGAVPYVGAGRVRRGAVSHHRLPVHRLQGGGLRAGAAAGGGGLRAGGRPLGAVAVDSGGAGGGDDDGGQPGRAGAAATSSGLMAYSSIGHSGFLLAGIAALSLESNLPSNGVMLYLVGYSVTNFVVFGGLIAFFNMTGKEMMSDLAGLGGTQPFLAASIAIGMFSLAGLPIFAGFAIKFYLFTAVADEGFLWLAGLAVFASLVSLYYYLQVIRWMYIAPAEGEPAFGHGYGYEHIDAEHDEHEETEEEHEPAQPAPRYGEALFESYPALGRRPSVTILAVLGAGLLAVFWIGIYPAPLMDTIDAASRALLP